MVSVDERMQILKMIEEGKVTPEEGAKLLRALGGGKKRAASRADVGQSTARWFRVRVTDTVTGRNKVNVTIPLGLVNVGLRMGARFIPETSDVDVEELVEQIRSGAHGKVFESISDDDGEHVEIFIE
jgi:hypothetical protein